MTLSKDAAEPPSLPTKLSYLRLVIDKARIAQDVYNHPYQGSGTPEDPYIITWTDNDPGNPQLLPTPSKYLISLLVALSTLAVAFSSSAYSGGLLPLIHEFHLTNTTVATLGVSLFVLGFAVGPLLWAPLSELYGRQPIFALSYGAFTALNAGAAAAPNITSLLVLRFLAGAFGSSPLTNAGGVIADVFSAAERGAAMGAFALAPFLGPTIGPIVGGFVGQEEGWRWIEGVMAIFTGVIWILTVALVPETFAPALLRARAEKMSAMTGRVYVSAPDRATGALSAGRVFGTTLLRPLRLLVAEPIVLLLSLYMAIIYGILYMLFGAYPIVFQQHRGWGPGIGGLAFVGVAVGMVVAVVYAFPGNRAYAERTARAPRGRLPPEERLKAGIVGAVALPVGLFWFAWTNGPDVHWMASVAAGAPFGFGMILVFLAVTNYLIDTYTIYAASVLAANSVLRSLFGFAFPLFTQDMYEALGIHWASSIPAFLALACVPMPLVFYRYGESIRMRCKYAAESEEFMTKINVVEVKDAGERTSGGLAEDSDLERVATVPVPYKPSPLDIDRVNTSTSRKEAKVSRHGTRGTV